MPYVHEFFIFKQTLFQWYGWSNFIFYILGAVEHDVLCFWPFKLALIHYIELIWHPLGFIKLLLQEIYLIQIQMQ